MRRATIRIQRLPILLLVVYVATGGCSCIPGGATVFVGEEERDNSGWSVAAADVDGDGRQDVVIGSQAKIGDMWDAGRAYVVLADRVVGGGRVELSSADAFVTGDTEMEMAGSVVASAGDVDGDGRGDVLIGAHGWPGRSEEPLSAGAAGVFQGDTLEMDGDLQLEDADAIVVGEVRYSSVGASLAGVGDVDGDGLDDVLIGSAGLPYVEGELYNRAALVLGAGLASGTNSSLMDHPTQFLGGHLVLGTPLAGAGDVDGDGLDDIVMGFRYFGSPEDDMDFASTSSDPPDDDEQDLPDPVVGIFLASSFLQGGERTIGDADFVLEGESNGDSTGNSVSSAEDVDGDGWPDILVGAPGWGGATGRAYVVRGGPSLTETPQSLADAWAILEGDGQHETFGWCISSAGDVDGDGLTDVLVGAPGIGPDTLQSSAAYLFSGQTLSTGGLLTTEDAFATLLVSGSDIELGRSVSSAGDVDGDGLDDVLIGGPAPIASHYMEWEENPYGYGRTWLVFGSALGDGGMFRLTDKGIRRTD